MDLVRVVVCNCVGNLYFGAVFSEGISVVFRNPHIRLGEVYDVTVRENGAPSSAKAKFDVVECRSVPTHEYTNIRVAANKQVLVTCLADFVSYDDKDRSVKVFRNEVFGLIIDLDNIAPNQMKNVEVEFRFIASPRDRFSTICVVTKFIKGNNITCGSSNRKEEYDTSSDPRKGVKIESRRSSTGNQEPCIETNRNSSGLVRKHPTDLSDSMFASRIRRPKYNRAKYMLDEDEEEIIFGSVQNSSSTRYHDDSYSHNAPSSYILNKFPEYTTVYIGFVNHVHSSGKAVVWCTALYRDIVMDISYSKSMSLGDWIEFTVNNSAPPNIVPDSIRIINDPVPTRIVNGHPELKCNLVLHDPLPDHSGRFNLYSDILGDVLCDIPSVCNLLGPACRLKPWIVRLRCSDDSVRWVISSKYNISPNDIEQVAEYNVSSYVQNTPPESADRESLPDSYCSSPRESMKIPFEELSDFSSEVTLDYVFNKHPSLLNLLAAMDEEAHERMLQLMQ